MTGVALALSLRHGAATAVMALVGGFLTPLLVGNLEAGALPLLAYLALLDIALFLLAWRRRWTWLAAAAVVLSFVWTGFLIAQPGPRDALHSGAFVVLLALAAALVRPGAGRQHVMIRRSANGPSSSPDAAAVSGGGPGACWGLSAAAWRLRAAP